jgi:ketosteroid isomerase-like protein
MRGQVPIPDAHYTKEQQEVVDVDRILNEAVLRGDVATLDRIFAPDVMFIGNDGRIWNKQERIEDFRSRNRAYASERMIDFHVRVYQTTAIVAFTDWVEGTRDGRSFKTRSYLTRVYMKRGGLWQLVHQQSAQLERLSQ